MRKKTVSRNSAGKVRIVRTEQQEQEDVAFWLRSAGIDFCAVPNGGVRHIRTAVKLRAGGVEAGVPDLLIFTPPPLMPDARGVAIEMKRTVGGAISEAQREWQTKLRRNGWVSVICAGANVARAFLIELGYSV